MKNYQGGKHKEESAGSNPLFSPSVLDIITNLNDNSMGLWDAAVAMKQLGPNSVTSIMRVLNGNTSMVRIPAIWALGEIGDVRAVPHLVRILEHDPSRFNRMMAAVALLKLDDPVGLEKVKQEFRTSGPKDAGNPADTNVN